MFFHKGAYTNYPLVQIGEGYGAEDLEPDNDPGGILNIQYNSKRKCHRIAKPECGGA